MPLFRRYRSQRPLLAFIRTGCLIISTANVFATEPQIDFNRDIRPILSDNCFKCHGPDETTREADLRLDSKEGLFADMGAGYFPVVSGHPTESEIIWRIETDDEEDLMPPLDSNLSLSHDEKQLLRNWIEAGAEWKGHWAFEPVSRPAPPSVSAQRWVRNDIDPFILARLEKEGLSPSPEADRTTLIRRVSLDLTGLPPTPAEVDAFLADDSPDVYERLVDRLLDSPRYGETMALPWLDAARYADTDGYQNDGPRTMWRWRDWVIDAYNRNLPFDQFTIEQLAGDLLPNPTHEQVLATGFNRNHRYNSEAGLVLEEFLLENAVDRVDTTSTVWMGMTVACARCHDHKYDPISTKEYYQLVSIFDNVPESGRAVKYGNSEPWLTTPTAAQAAELAILDQQVQAALNRRENAATQIVRAIEDWEERGTPPPDENALLNRGLLEHFQLEDPDPTHESDETALRFGNGIRDRAAIFDGSSQLALSNQANFLCNERFSIAFWLKPTDATRGVVLSKQGTNSTRPGLAVELKNGKLEFAIITRWIAGVGAIETRDTIPTDSWIHVTLTNDGSQSATGMRILLDGQPVETRIVHNTNSNIINPAKNAELLVGGGVVGDNYSGAIDDLRIYDRTLRTDEARLLAEPDTLTAILAKPSQERDARETAKWHHYFAENLAPPALAEFDQALHTARLEHEAFHDSLPTTMVMQEMSPARPTHVRTRGVYHQLGEQVEDQLPTIFPDYPEGAPHNRLGFAQWLVSGQHPLTGRVAVNRYWLKYFGRGLVKSAEDFGVQGDWPSHPSLLDWLADEFVRTGWDVKAMQRLIVTSATYRQQSRVTPALLEIDPFNILLARGPRQRLSAQVLRDQALATSGLLVERIGGPSVSPYQPAKLWEQMSNMKYQQSSGEDLYRKSLYTIWKRTVPPPAMALMDAADRESCIVSPKRTNTPLQALALLNEKLFVEAARNLGQRLLTEGGNDLDNQVTFGFRMVTSRAPHYAEHQLLRKAYQEYRDAYHDTPEDAEALVAIGESPVSASLDPRELAAATAFANVLLNLDETLTKE
ncbi:MAG: DUF1553 domain-containing protein [Synoicihabitans sp.]